MMFQDACRDSELSEIAKQYVLVLPQAESMRSEHSKLFLAGTGDVVYLWIFPRPSDKGSALVIGGLTFQFFSPQQLR